MSITGIKGMNDILPGEIETWQFLEETARKVFRAYGFAEIRTPAVEKTDLFCRSIGETTDIVEKEMYSFRDKSDNSITLRPEGTASVIRSFIEHKMYANDPVAKLYYLGPMFRYERPQKGRYRQFHQIGAEAIGIEDPRIDAQILAMLSHYFDAIGIGELELQLNSLGCPECRPAFREELLAFLETRLESLCDDCRRRYTANPLRTLDCKAAGCREATTGAPAMMEKLCAPCDDHFARVQGHLRDLGTPFALNPRMVRGLDYYTKTTFEVVTGNLGAQNAVAAGGRYDGLIRSLGGPALPGIGFAMGVERLVLLKSQERIAPSRPDLFFAAIGQEAGRRVFSVMCALQKRGVQAETDLEGKSLKSQMRRAGKLNARYTVIVGEDELARGVAVVRDMDRATQKEISLSNLEESLAAVVTDPHLSP